MPKGPNGQKRPGDVIGAAIMVAKIATGEIEEPTEIDDGKDPAAKALGKKGGAARVAKLTPEKRTEIAQKAAKTRWKASPVLSEEE
ncbi:hypothetical protein GCM10011611_57040 [Aliidongia dinghuensis]|uniref:RNA-binding protein n=1 Tax=Aliidongia dinghuensis TaxID=1867774 RepID=A0A8J2Z031_9PROT|nr:RNA-binding protein [Aliidongia dinghuensis]GGF43215.1 hypothetical protein GCM10011611_57040 [Aliidongia dinghuensis]